MTDASPLAGVDIDANYLVQLKDIVSKTKSQSAKFGSFSGSIAGQKRGRGSIYYDVRPWSEGDDIRRLDPHKTARTGIPHVRTSHEDHDNNVILIADFRSSMFFGSRRALRAVVAAELIALTGWGVMTTQGQTGLLAVNSRDTIFIGWANNSSKFSSLLDKLASFYHDARSMNETSNLCMDEVMETILRRSERAKIIVATSLDEPGKNFDKITGLIAKRRELIYLLIADKFERAPLSGRYPYYTVNGETGVIKVPRHYDNKSYNKLPERLVRLGARSRIIASESHPSETARVLDQLYHGSR